MYINGELVREYREENGISLEDMADNLGIESSLLDRYENGEPWDEEGVMTLLVLDTIFSENLDYIILTEEDII